jgi:hypothetical protein
MEVRGMAKPQMARTHGHQHEKAQSQKSQQDLLNELHPVFKHKVGLILSHLGKLGWQPKIIYARRTEEQQRDAIRRGASHTMLSWHVENTIRLLPAGAHLQVIRGNAVDIVDKRYGWEGKAKSKDFQFWKDLGSAAHNNGCQWGGDWKPVMRKGKDGKMHVRDQRDVAHVQMFFTEEREQDSFTA